MNICVPKERRPFEYRVGLPPAGVDLFRKHEHQVYVETGAGDGAGFTDEDYLKAGADIVYSTEEVFGRANLVLKFTRPMLSEIQMMQEGQCISGFLHIAAARQDKIDLLLKHEITSIAYEQVEDEDGFKPIMAPLSQIGGRMVVQVGAGLLQTDQGGRGILLGGVAGVPPAEIVIIGGGIVGSTAAMTFAGVGAHVTILDISLKRLQSIQSRSRYPFVTMLSTPYNIRRACSFADLLVGAVHVPSSLAPTVVTREMVASMKPRSVIIDMSIDQGGCIETSRPTNHESPTYEEEGVIHYCVPNMPGVLGRSATYALFMGAYPYLEIIAQQGIEQAIEMNDGLKKGVTTRAGKQINLLRLGDGAEAST